jgi:hypothetical protein
MTGGMTAGAAWQATIYHRDRPAAALQTISPLEISFSVIRGNYGH